MPTLTQFVDGIARAEPAGERNDSAPHHEPQDHSNLTSDHASEDAGQ
jgi:hypothetical protein